MARALPGCSRQRASLRSTRNTQRGPFSECPTIRREHPAKALWERYCNRQSPGARILRFAASGPELFEITDGAVKLLAKHGYSNSQTTHSPRLGRNRRGVGGDL